MRSFKPFLCLAITAAFLSSCDKDSALDAYANVDYIPVKETEKGNWGFYSPDGKVLFEDEFKSRPSLVINGYFSVEESDGYTLYKFGDKLTPVPEAEGLKAIGGFNENLIPIVRPKERISVIDKRGETQFVINPIDGKEIERCVEAFVDGMLGIKNEDGLYGFINNKGEAVIPPQYKEISYFHNGMALVKLKEDGYSFIDKQGQNILQLKKDYKPLRDQFVYGYLPVRDSNDRIVLLNKKGEVSVKCLGSVRSIVAMGKKYYIFMNDNEMYGVASYDGDLIINPKYEYIQLIAQSKFLVRENEKDPIFGVEKIINKIVNEREETILTFDDEYKYIFWMGKFNYLLDNGKVVMFLNQDGKFIKNTEFYNVNTYDNYKELESDYIDVAPVIDYIISLLNSNGVGKYTFGSSPSQYFNNPRDFVYRETIDLKDLQRSFKKVKISCTATFSKKVSSGIQMIDLSIKDCHWEEDCELKSFDILIDSNSEWDRDNTQMLIDELEQDGFTILSHDDYPYEVALMKNNIILVIHYYYYDRPSTISVFKRTAEKERYYKLKNESRNVVIDIPETFDAEMDSCLADSCVY